MRNGRNNILVNALTDDLGFTKNSDGFPQVDIQIKIEPATLLLLLGGVAGAIVINKVINNIF